MLIKVFAVGFALFALRRLIARYRKGGTLTVELILWLTVWIGVGIVVFIPQKTDIVAHWLGVGSGFDALTFVTIVALLYAVYRLYARVQAVERDLTCLVRASALQTATRIANQSEPVATSSVAPEVKRVA